MPDDSVLPNSTNIIVRPPNFLITLSCVSPLNRQLVTFIKDHTKKITYKNV